MESKEPKDKLKVKVCGMRETQNISDVALLRPDFMGFIFYSLSKRSAYGIDPDVVRSLPESITPVAVFVDATFDEIKNIIYLYDIDHVQLHGEESPQFCKSLKDEGITVIKAVKVKTCLPSDLAKYKNNIDFFLFDTAGKTPGGNGIKFNWRALENYHLDIPYFLSGGIGPEDLNLLTRSRLKGCFAIDVNSKFEDYPGHKNIKALQDLQKL